MKKRLIAVLLCFCMAACLLPFPVYAAEDISSSGLDLSVSAPTVVTTYQAGSGTVTWDPTVTPATLTFDNATIAASSSSTIAALTAINLPYLASGLNVVFKGTNSISADSLYANVFDCNGTTTFTLLPDSNTVLNAGHGKLRLQQASSSPPPLYLLPSASPAVAT